MDHAEIFLETSAKQDSFPASVFGSAYLWLLARFAQYGDLGKKRFFARICYYQRQTLLLRAQNHSQNLGKVLY